MNGKCWPPWKAKRASSVAHSSNWQKSVSHDTFILTDQLGCPSLQKGEGGEEGRLPLSLPLSLPSILEQRSPLSLHPLPSHRPKRCNLRRPPSRNRRSAWSLLCAPTCRRPPRYACESTGRRRCRHGGRGRRGDGTERGDDSCLLKRGGRYSWVIYMHCNIAACVNKE